MANEESRYIRAFLKGRGYERPIDSIRMLEAHGNSHSSCEYLYADKVDSKLKWFPVLDWISMHDGAYDMLYVSCCNKGNVMLPSYRSTLMYSIGEHSGAELDLEVLGEARSNLIVVSSIQKL